MQHVVKRAEHRLPHRAVAGAIFVQPLGLYAEEETDAFHRRPRRVAQTLVTVTPADSSRRTPAAGGSAR